MIPDLRRNRGRAAVFRATAGLVGPRIARARRSWDRPHDGGDRGTPDRCLGQPQHPPPLTPTRCEGLTPGWTSANSTTRRWPRTSPSARRQAAWRPRFAASHRPRSRKRGVKSNQGPRPRRRGRGIESDEELNEPAGADSVIAEMAVHRPNWPQPGVGVAVVRPGGRRQWPRGRCWSESGSRRPTKEDKVNDVRFVKDGVAGAIRSLRSTGSI